MTRQVVLKACSPSPSTHQKPEDLEKLEQYRRKVARKKVSIRTTPTETADIMNIHRHLTLSVFQATVESQLRNAVQTQLEGVQTGLENLGE